MRLTPTRCIIVILTALTFFITWRFVAKSHSRPTKQQSCFYPEEYQNRLHQLIARVHHVLSTLDLSHFLCYGALWGQIRLSRTLPWENNADFCLINEEVITRDEVYVIRMFRKHDMDISYDTSEGKYTILDLKTEFNEAPRPYMSVSLIVFELDKLVNMYRRVGWKRRLLPPDCEAMESLNCFPPRLIQFPLPMKEFGRVLVPVPREGIEIQKYHYRHNWWKEIVPKNC